MTKTQRVKYEMFGRVQRFGAVNSDVFPEAGAGAQAFAQVAEAVAAIEEFLARRTQARAEARRVKATTRKAVTRYMKAVAATGRRVAEGEWGTHAFRMPARKSAPVILSTARLFIEEAERRKDKFVALGMAPTFLTDFRRLVDELALAISLQQDSRATRRKAQAGIESTLTRGFSAIRNLDVIVANTCVDDAVRLAQWQGARHLDGATARPAKAAAAPVPVTENPAPVRVLEPVLEKAS